MIIKLQKTKGKQKINTKKKHSSFPGLNIDKKEDSKIQAMTII